LSKALAAEFIISVGVNSWGAIQQSQVPWPGTITRIGVAFGILGVVSMWDEQIAELLGGAFLLASLVNLASQQGTTGKWTKAFGAVPPKGGDTFPYYTLGWGTG
jgi:hypothetical protein